MHTIEKGELGRYIAVTRFLQLGYSVSVPISENSAYDLVVEKAGTLLRVQVKARYPHNGVLHVALKTQKAKRSGGERNYTAANIDWLVTVNLDDSRCYWLDMRSGQYDRMQVMHLRLLPSKNGQHYKCNFASDFLL